MSMEWEPKRKDGSMYEIDDTQIIGPSYADTWVIIFEGRSIRGYSTSNWESDLPTFKDILKIAEQNGWNSQSEDLYLIVEAALYGIVFAYGRYKDKFWEVHGHTKGYA